MPRLPSSLSRANHYAVVWCADFRLQAVLRRSNRGIPVALIDDSKRQSVVLCCNPVAEQAGVFAGIPTVQALARCPDLTIKQPSAAAETAAERVLLELALNWVPLIEETEQGMVTLDLSSQPEMHRDDSARSLLNRLDSAGLDVVVGMGETPSLARIAAQVAQERGIRLWHLAPENRSGLLEQLPVSVAEISAGLVEKLHLWGVDTLGAFAGLRREMIASRLGEEGVELWLRLTGRLQRPLKPASLELLFEEHYDFEYEVREREPVLFILHRFIERLTIRLSGTGRAATAVHLLLSFSDGSCYGKRLPLPEPTLDEDVLFRVGSGHLETLELKSGISSVRLRLEPSDLIASQQTLFGAGLKNRHHYEETLKRLRQIVGSDRVGSPRPKDTHRPDQFELVPLSAEIDEPDHQAALVVEEEGLRYEASGAKQIGATFRRYARRVVAEVEFQDEIPTRLDSSRAKGIVTTAYGPWRNEGEWWDHGKAWNRVEWDLELKQKGLFRLVGKEGEWVVEGYYD
ncbi:MAG: DNA polymerase Y family protein [Verrucomicrobiales bacterium]|nr:DNA polymerase Y family protein [Verrucomicrobiales bacterium]